MAATLKLWPKGVLCGASRKHYAGRSCGGICSQNKQLGLQRTGKNFIKSIFSLKVCVQQSGKVHLDCTSPLLASSEGVVVACAQNLLLALSESTSKQYFFLTIVFPWFS